MRRIPWPLTLAAILFVGLRARVLALDFDGQCNPGYELTMIGNIAHALQGGWNGPPLADYYDNSGGHLVCGLLAAPLFALFGESYLTLKLVPLLFGLGTLVLVWRLLEPRAGRLAASVAVLAFATGPPTLVHLSMLSMGNHFESLFFAALVYLAWLAWIEGGLRPLRGFLFGLCAAFATFFYFGALLWIALFALAHLVQRGPRATVGDWLRTVPGFLLGAAPLAWILLATGGRPLGFLSHNLGTSLRPSLGQAFQRAREFLFIVLPEAGSFRDLGPLPGAAVEWWAILVFVLAWGTAGVAFVRSRRPHGEDGAREGTWAFLPLVLYFPALIAAFAFSRFRFTASEGAFDVVSLRYLASHQFVAMLLVGTAVGWLARGSAMRRRLATGLAIAALATAPLALTLETSGSNAPGDGARYSGWSSRYLARVLLRDGERIAGSGELAWDTDTILEHVLDVPAGERGGVVHGLGYYQSWIALDRPTDLPAALLGAYPAELHADLARGIGSYLREQARLGFSSVEEVRARIESFLQEEPEVAPLVVQGLAMSFDFPLRRQVELAPALDRRLREAVPEALLEDWALGLGRAHGHAVRFGTLDAARALEDATASVPGALLDAYRSGLRSLLDGASPDP